MPFDPDDVQLSSNCTRGQYKQWVQADDRQRLGTFFKERFEERYFAPVLHTTTPHGPEDSRQGFTMMAVGCLVVETLEAFNQGLPHTRWPGVGLNMFESFFRRVPALRVFVATTHGLQFGWFYEDIRCGILHEAEIRGGWRLWRKGAPLCDLAERIINPEVFVEALRTEVTAFAGSFSTNPASWANFKTKMSQVCANCER